jgi:site-specific recombinase XerD
MTMIIDRAGGRTGDHLPARQTAGLSPAALAAVEAGMPETTRRAYHEDVQRFREWCAEHGHPGLPTDGNTLTEYAAYLTRTPATAGRSPTRTRPRSPAAIERARWAIVKWHKLAEIPPPSTEGLVAVLKGYREQLALAKSPAAAPRKASAAGRDPLAAMLAAMDRDTLAGCRDAAILLGGFAIGARRGELAGLDIPDVDLRDDGMQVSVYRQKTRQLHDPVVKYRPDQSLCPVRAVAAWIGALAAAGRTTGPLFPRIDKHGHLAHPVTRNGVLIGDPTGRMTGQAVAQVIQRRALAAGLGGKWSGHSLRRGLATEMHRGKQDRRLIERQGGWTAGSSAVSGYIDDADRWLVDVLEGVL